MKTTRFSPPRPGRESCWPRDSARGWASRASGRRCAPGSSGRSRARGSSVRWQRRAAPTAPAAPSSRLRRHTGSARQSSNASTWSFRLRAHWQTEAAYFGSMIALTTTLRTASGSVTAPPGACTSSGPKDGVAAGADCHGRCALARTARRHGRRHTPAAARGSSAARAHALAAPDDELDVDGIPDALPTRTRPSAWSCILHERDEPVAIDLVAAYWHRRHAARHADTRAPDALEAGT